MNAVAAPPIHHTFTAFGGAHCEVFTCDATNRDVSAAVADTYTFERQLTRFDPASELSRFNDAAGTRVAVSPLLGELLRVSLDAYALSDGLVNAACLPALVAAGYDRTIGEVQRRGSARPRRDGMPLPGLPDVLDLGTGWARTRPRLRHRPRRHRQRLAGGSPVRTLRQRRVNLGGDMRVRGDGPDGAGWSVALCDDSVVSVRDAGIATSGTLGRRWPGGHHLIDPRTGSPSTTDIATISIVADTAVHAEVLAKTACLLGSTEATAWLELHGCARHTLQ